MLVEPIAYVAAWARRLIERKDANGAAPVATDAIPRITSRKPAMAAKGSVDRTHRKGVRRIAVTFEDAQFARVQARAEAEHVSFSEAARRLIERGLERPEA
jgi:hypothetical protein